MATPCAHGKKKGGGERTPIGVGQHLTPVALHSDRAGKDPGCGPWTAPLIDNPDYKGPWYPPMIANPAYKGEFVPRQIDNPEYFEDKEPWKSLAPIGAVALELWSMDKDVLFDNILITRDVSSAVRFADLTWAVRHKAEAKKRDEQIDDAFRTGLGDSWQDQLTLYLRKASVFVDRNLLPVCVATFFVVATMLALCCMPWRRAPSPGPSAGDGAGPSGSTKASTKEAEGPAGGGDDKAKSPVGKVTRRTPKAAE